MRHSRTMADIVCTSKGNAIVPILSLQQRRREDTVIWRKVLFWRSRAHLHRRTKASRQFKDGAFLGPARVLLQERERKRDDIKYKAVVWVVDGDQLVRCSSAHLRPVVHSRTNIVFAERWRGSDFSTSGAGTSKAQFRGSCWTALTNRGRFRRTDERGI